MLQCFLVSFVYSQSSFFYKVAHVQPIIYLKFMYFCMKAKFSSHLMNALDL